MGCDMHDMVWAKKFRSLLRGKEHVLCSLLGSFDQRKRKKTTSLYKCISSLLKSSMTKYATLIC